MANKEFEKKEKYYKIEMGRKLPERSHSIMNNNDVNYHNDDRNHHIKFSNNFFFNKKEVSNPISQLLSVQLK